MNGGGGSGGRIAAYYNNTFKDAFYNGTFDSEGGTAALNSESGAAGTVYMKHSGKNYTKLIVDNKGAWTMETEIEAKGYKLELYHGNSGTGRSSSIAGNTVTSSCPIWYVWQQPSYALSNLFDQSYMSSYSYYFIGNCASGSITIGLKTVMLVNSVRIFPMQGTNFKVGFVFLFSFLAANCRGTWEVSMPLFCRGLFILGPLSTHPGKYTVKPRKQEHIFLKKTD